MTILRSIKDEFSYYHHLKLDTLVALDAENHAALIAFRKQNKKGSPKSKSKGKVKGYQFIEDEELGTLKIDFSTLLTFDVNDLEKAK
jgi:hypothetical protein